LCSPRQRGVVLLVTLVMIMVMAWVMVELLASVRREILRGQTPSDQEELREISYQLLDISIGVLAEVKQFEGDLYAPIQGWGRPLQLASVMERARRPLISQRESSEADYFRSFSQEDRSDGEPPGRASLLEELERDEAMGDFVLRAPAASDLSESGDDLSPEQVWGLGLEIAPIAFRPGIEVSVEIFDEGGKLSLTRTSEARWRLFFEVMGFEESEQRILTDSLLDWMDSDNRTRPFGAETDFYSQRTPPYRAANRPLRDFGELRLIQGFDVLFFDEEGTPNANFTQFKEAVSLLSVSPVNLNSAHPLVLETLAEEQGFDLVEVNNFIAGSDLVRGTSDDRILRPGINQDNLPRRENGEFIKHNQPTRLVQVIIHVSSGLSHFQLTAIIDLERPGRNSYPVRVLQIMENRERL
jgi:hypothetical protein